ncbi:hypothetical protein AAG906_002142 [Vitis piasezkii]
MPSPPTLCCLTPLNAQGFHQTDFFPLSSCHHHHWGDIVSFYYSNSRISAPYSSLVATVASTIAVIASAQHHEHPTTGTIIPATGCINITNIAFSRTSRKVYGPTKLKFLTSQCEHLPVNFNMYGQAIGDNGKKLSSYLGIMAHDGQLAPLNYSSWKEVLQEEKTKMFQVIKAFVNYIKDKNNSQKFEC